MREGVHVRVCMRWCVEVCGWEVEDRGLAHYTAF